MHKKCERYLLDNVEVVSLIGSDLAKIESDKGSERSEGSDMSKGQMDQKGQMVC